MALSSFSATRVLYKQNFETAVDAAAAGWSFGGESMSILSDGEGKYLQLALGQNNGRSGQVTWGQEIFLNHQGESLLEDGTYHVHFEFSIAQGSSNQYNSAFTIFTNHAPVVNQPYRNPWSPAGYWQNYLFDMSQVASESYSFAIDGGTIETVGEDGTKTYAIDYEVYKTFDAGKWYCVDLDVNVIDRTVDYKVTNFIDPDDIIQDGTLNVPETDVNGDPISMYAEGLFVMVARYQTKYDFDNIEVYFESEKDYANPPAVALTMLGKNEAEELNLNLRTYTIKFLEGETLHLIGTDGQEITVEYEDCDGSYPYSTTVSGTLKAWTTSGEATSEVIETVVDCNPCVLPEAEATISSVSAGFGKTYTLTVSNKEVPLQPTIFIDYKFVAADGTVVVNEEGAASGVKVEVPGKGTLTVTTAAFGYESKTIVVENDTEFETKKTWDFARLTEEEISAALTGAAWNTLNSGATSGFNNWTARKRLYYSSATETEEKEVDGEMVTVPVSVYPFGFISEDNTTNVIKYAVIDRAAIPETTKGQYFEGLTIFPERGKVDEGGLPNVGMLYRIGLYNDQTKNNNNNVYINDLDLNDFVVVNYINNYGGNSNHPVCANDDEYYAQLEGENAVYSVAKDGTLNEAGFYDVAYALYRIDTAITKITVFKPAGSIDAVEAVEAVVAGDNYWYSIDGVRVAEPTRPGLYIHNGKKVIVK